jgi:hypothetical protein
MIFIKNSFLFFLIAIIGFSHAREINDEPQVLISLKRTSTHDEIKIKNISKKSLTLGPVYFSDSEESGYWLFLYDIDKKAIEKGWATTQPTRSRAPSYQKTPPMGEISVKYQKGELVGYFFEEPKCYYLIVVYRKKQEGKTVFSRPSNPLLKCQDK